jgi:hypothetical protein
MCRANVLALTVALTLTGWAAGQGPPRLSPEGRFLYADDDDWDWASPAGTNEPCRLSIYGRMPWSALDWMEEGLSEVRGVLIGTPPESGGYLTMADLNRVRKAGLKRSYEQLKHTPKILANVLKDRKPPNLIILMQDISPAGNLPLTPEEAEAGLQFVRRGGRLLVLDDWSCYRLLVTPYLDERRFRRPPRPVTEVQRRAVEQKARLLGAEDVRIREKAQAELLKLGKGVVPALEAIKPASPEQAARIRVILRTLRPPVLKLPGTNDSWLADAVQTTLALHEHAELKTIFRNGDQAPGSALCIRIPAAKAVKKR